MNPEGFTYYENAAIAESDVPWTLYSGSLEAAALFLSIEPLSDRASYSVSFAADQTDQDAYQPGAEQKRYRPPELTGLRQVRCVRSGRRRSIRRIGVGDQKCDAFPADRDCIVFTFLFHHGPDCVVLEIGPGVVPVV